MMWTELRMRVFSGQLHVLWVERRIEHFRTRATREIQSGIGLFVEAVGLRHPTEMVASVGCQMVLGHFGMLPSRPAWVSKPVPRQAYGLLRIVGLPPRPLELQIDQGVLLHLEQQVDWKYL